MINKFEGFQESIETPAMIEVYHNQAWHTSMCFAFAYSQVEAEHHVPTALFAIIGGSDSSLQSIKASMDLGFQSMAFGYGQKDTQGYQFKRHFEFKADKGKYTKDGMTINANRKGLTFVHEDLMNGEYVLSFEGQPFEELRKALGGAKFGLHILPEWSELIYEEMKSRGYIKELDVYFDPNVFVNGFSIFKLDLNEEQCDEMISNMIASKVLKFPVEGNGSSLEEVTDLTNYLVEYNQDMVNKLSDEVEPTHNPLNDSIHPVVDTFERTLFPVQAHVATAIAKRLQEQKSVILQGEMSTGKTAMMTSIADITNQMKGKKGYFACVLCPPSLTKKWATEEIGFILPHAAVHWIQNTSELIQFHTAWTNAGRPKPTKPTFFVMSFSTMKNDTAIVPAIKFTHKTTPMSVVNQEEPYKKGYYCNHCGHLHEVIESTNMVINENGEEEEVVTKRPMKKDEFGESRRIHNSTNPQNAFCSNCGDSLWTKKSATRYSSFREWTKHEKQVLHYCRNAENKNLLRHYMDSQPEVKSKQGKPRRVAAIEYIRRKMNNFFDISIVDEVHLLKASNSAQGNCLSALVQCSKNTVAGTGTLFGGKLRP